MNHLLKTAALFSKLAQQEQSTDQASKEQIVNTPVSANNMAWRDAATLVLQYLKQFIPTDSDAGAQNSASKPILDILNAIGAPTAEQLIAAAQGAYNTLTTNPIASKNQAALATAKYFLALTKVVVYKFFGQKFPGTNPAPQSQQQPTPQDQQQPAAPATKPNESASKFLSRIYRTLKQNAEIPDADFDAYNSFKDFYTRRLNGLNSLKTRTPQQEEEKNLLQYVIKAMA